MQTLTSFSKRAAYLFTIFFVALCPAFGQTSVLTQHNDVARTGQNLSETILTPANVSSGGFGKIFSLPTDGNVLAQPLYVPGLTVNGASHNVVFVATEHDSVYAFDADAGGAPLWQVSLLSAAHGAAAGATSDPSSVTGCTDQPEYGVTGTPVIDPSSNTMYLVSDSLENNYPVQRLHALDITTGLEKFGGPVVIQASAAGSGTGSSGNVVSFDPKWENQRPGLLLANGNIYIGWSAHCDFGPFHGWLMSYNATTLAQTSVFLPSPNGEASGIWMGGSGLAVDNEGGQTRMFLATGNGTYDATTPYATNTMDYGDDILRLNLSNGLQVADAFTPSDQAARSSGDIDLGAGGTLILPDQPGPYPHLLVLTGKGNEIFLVNRDNLGGYNPPVGSTPQSNNVVQELDGQDSYLWGMPAYWNENIYIWAAEDKLKQFSLTNGLLSTTPVETGLYKTSAGLGSTPSISANGTTNAILWIVDSSQSPEVLYAVDATNVSNTFYSSATKTTDSAGANVKYPVPTIVNGKVYVAGVSQVSVYGILPAPGFSISATSGNVGVVDGGSSNDTINVTDLNGFSGAVVLTATGLPAGVTASFAASTTGTSAVASFSALTTAAPGTYPINVIGTSGSLVSSVGLTLQVQANPSFTLTATPSAVSVQEGGTVTSAIGVAPVNGFAGTPSFSISGLPTGVSAVFAGTSSPTAFTLTLTASSTAAVGTFPVVITGTSGALTASVPVTLSVTAGLNLTGVQLVNRATGACLNESSIFRTFGVKIQQATCGGESNQLWNLAAATGGSYEFVSIGSGLVLDISGSSKAAGATVTQDNYRTLTSQQWSLQATNDGYFNFVNKNSGLCLDGSESSVTTGAVAEQQPCSGAASQKWSLVPLSNTTPVNLSGFYNVNGIVTNGTAVPNGGFDNDGYAFSESTIGGSHNWLGYQFIFGQANVPDAVSSTTITLPAGQYNGLYFLAAAVNGAQTNQTFTVHYSDGSVATLQQSLNDWANPRPLFGGEQVALSASYRLASNGQEQGLGVNVFGVQMALDSTRTAVSLTLPNNRNVVVLAITLGK